MSETSLSASSKEGPKTRRFRLGLGLLAVIIFFGLGLLLIRTYPRGQPAAENLLNRFMQAMAANEIETAYNYFSERTQVIIPLSELASLRENHPERYLYYDHLDIAHFQVSRVTHENPHAPQGQVAQVAGTIFYQDGREGVFAAALEKTDAGWRIAYIEITTDLVLDPDQI